MEQIAEPATELSIAVDATPDVVWAVVSDVARIPEWSPVCYRCEWLDSGSPVVGARFRGYNRLNGVRWSRECIVTAAEPGRLFAFSTLFKGKESTRWRYRIDSMGGATHVSEAYQIVLIPLWLRLLRHLPGAKAKTERDTRANIETSLARLKAIVERG